VWTRNPINSLDLLASADNRRLAYCLFPYGYSNYSRAGYAAHPLTFGDLPAFGGKPLRSVLGGTGLAVSALRPHRSAALAYATFCASGEIQRTVYTRAGGQPGYRTAWLDADNNRLAGNYFTNTLPALDRAWVRPRHSGYPVFQERAGPVVQAALKGVLPPDDALAQLDALHRTSLLAAPVHP
jgi:multiple sugar transport system substrate-binding protein